jgi:hypothetical protein
MPLKRRRPKERMVTVTPKALELFLAMERLERGCDEWYDRHAELHKEVGARPWEYPLDSRNATHIWDALEKGAAASKVCRRSETASAPPLHASAGPLK